MAAQLTMVSLGVQPLAKSFQTFFMGAAGGGGGRPADGPIVTSSLYWHVDAANSSSYSGSGTTWTDLISSQNATLVNSPNYSTTEADGWGSFYFDGVNQYGTTSFTKAQAAFSVSAWHKPASPQAQNGMQAIMNTFEGQSAEWWSIATGGTGRGTPEFVCDNDSSKVTIRDSAEAPDSWQMITGTRSGSSMKLYVNTSLNTSANSLSTSDINGVEPMYIASRATGYGEQYTGYISDLKIYTKALSASEVTQNYNALKGRYGL
tara:strand:- start:932 stop:1717 length:786 start_codon:yes stop_codon:yes gene_type:complete